MEIDSVRALKKEVNARILRPLVRAAEQGGRHGIAARSLLATTPYEPGIALGVAAGRSPRDFRLAVRVQRRSLAPGNMSELAAGLDQLCSDEYDLRVVGSIHKRAPRPWQRKAQRPLLIGSSVGHIDITAGTIGAIALHQPSGKLVLLSNSHVLADEGRASPGDGILQPGTADGGLDPENLVAKLLMDVPLRRDRANVVDAAIATIGRRFDADPTTLRGLGILRGLRDEPVLPGLIVAKVGRTSGRTNGRVTAIELDDVVVDFEIGQLRFERQIEIEGIGDRAFSAPGDSGSLIVDERGGACGLLFAGSDVGGKNGLGLTFANDLQSVFRRLRLALVAGD